MSSQLRQSEPGFLEKSHQKQLDLIGQSLWRDQPFIGPNRPREAGVTGQRHQTEPGFTGPRRHKDQGSPRRKRQADLNFNRQSVHTEPGFTGPRRHKEQGSPRWKHQTDLNFNRQSVQTEPGFTGPKYHSVRDQISRVVLDLETVLGGLKQVHQEMKELVQQIDQLTSKLDLTGKESGNGYRSDTVTITSSSSGVVVSNKAGGHQQRTKPKVAAAFSTTKQRQAKPPPAPFPVFRMSNNCGADRPIVTKKAPAVRRDLPPTATRGRPPMEEPVWLPRRQGKAGGRVSHPLLQERPGFRSSITLYPGGCSGRQKLPFCPPNGEVVRLPSGTASAPASHYQPPSSLANQHYPTPRRITSTAV
ncbi:hypothetical protein AOXY_G31163 [Acipenser oxyrinchus oxyrinchus]|uniref:Protein Largen n=1 Tax=Acipenser oxyrinchus oxyrinchus TaxID=40147 RepID=A0AAD8CJW6_ACIOX|nr:hypothetical protein AOXY_G31163 [Acipenser oxyrinchus oxyrinchus]